MRAAGQGLDRDTYLELEKPSEKVPVIHYASVDDRLFDAVVNMCVEPGKMCMGEMMDIDRKGGLGLAAVKNTLPLVYDKYAGRGKSPAYFGSNDSYVMTICTPLQAEAAAADRMRRAELDTVAGPTSLERLTGDDRGRPIVFFCEPDCWMSWNAALRAVGYGYAAVHYYPEGAGGWASAGLPLEPVQPEPGPARAESGGFP